ncbi:CLIP-associating protein isoform X3 [Dermatophagoides pteronyssinus]|uniref:CLIP-associating protein isoform X3 n=1 Tax=Dermatophagoides pteronyssinus TaxID=6956 RepID=UPI003F6621FF
MASMPSTTLDNYLPLLSSQDTKKKLQIGTDLLNYLTIEENSIECEHIGAFIDSIIHWLNNSNFKVAQNGLEILAHLAIRMKENLKPYLSSIIGPSIDRLGDAKECVREQAKTLLIKLMSFVSTPQIILEKLMPAFSHKNYKVREEICLFFQECLLRYGVFGSTNGQLYVSKFIAPLINLMSDPNSQVRDTSMTTLVSVYKHVGDRLRNEIMRKYSNQMPAQKLQTLLAKFEEIANAGESITLISNNNNCGSKAAVVSKNRSNLTSSPNSTITNTNNNNNSNSNDSANNDEVDFKKVNSFKRATSAPPVKRNAILNKLPPSNSKSSGAADEEMFMNAFEDVSRIQIFSVKDLEQELNRIRDTCSNPNTEWEKRIECLRKFRSLLIAGAADYEEFYQYLKPLEVPFQTSVKDLRSQVVREACISIAYLSQRIGNKCDRFAEALLPSLIDSIQNSAKIMSSSAVVAIRFVIQHTHTSRLVPIITYNVSSKSKEIRKACCEFLDQLLHTWPPNCLERHVGTLSEAIKKGMSDADPEARALARKAFWGFADKFKAESDYLLSSLDSSKQRMLQGEQMSNWSSTNSLNKATTYSRPLTNRTNSVSTNGSIESINRHFSNNLIAKRSAIPVHSSSPRNNSSHHNTKKNDNVTDGCSINTAGSAMRTPARRNRQVSKSQPGSRSASPSSRLNAFCSNSGTGSSIPHSRYQTPSSTRTKRTSITSRDQSPASRTNNSSHSQRFERKLSSSSTASRTKSHLTSSDLDLAHNNRILRPNEHEQMIENAFLMHATHRKKFFDEQSDESDASSICSDTSFANYGVRKAEDIGKILENLSSTHWSDRKDGLLGLNNFLRYTDERLNSFQLKRITDIFTRMLVDPHTKAFSLFLNTLNELIHIYKNDLNSWLYILMTRLFLKAGSDTLGSIQTRILKTFELIRESFPIDHQFNVIMRLLSDQTQTLNTKVKIAVLQYLSKLIFLMDSSDFTYDRPNNHDIQTALVKIVSWTADIKSSDLRKISQDTIVDLYNLNSNEMTLYLNQLRKTYQDAALQIIQHKHKTRLSQSPASNVMQTPYIIKNVASGVHSHNISGDRIYFDSNDHLNPADIYDSLKKTSDEIQKYSFSLDADQMTSSTSSSPFVNNGPANSNHNGNNSENHRRVDAISNVSLDSGISPNSTLKHDSTLAFRSFKLLDNSFNSSMVNSSNNTANGFSDSPHSVTNGHQHFDSFVADFNVSSSDDENYQQNLALMTQFVKDSSPEEVATKCKDIYQSLLTRLHNEKNSRTKTLIIICMGQILFKTAKSSFDDLVESTLQTLMEIICKDEDKEVVKNAEATANYAIYNFDPRTSFKILQSYINHEESALSIIAIKLLTKLVELNDKEIVLELLPELMPPLLQAYDNKESAVRKTAVFCMVAIYGSVGEQMQSYLTSLSRSKMKLLKLYIDRSFQTSSGNNL